MRRLSCSACVLPHDSTLLSEYSVSGAVVGNAGCCKGACVLACGVRKRPCRCVRRDRLIVPFETSTLMDFGIVQMGGGGERVVGIGDADQAAVAGRSRHRLCGQCTRTIRPALSPGLRSQRGIPAAARNVENDLYINVLNYRSAVTRLLHAADRSAASMRNCLFNIAARAASPTGRYP